MSILRNGTRRMALAHEEMNTPELGEALVQLVGTSQVSGDVRRVLGTFNPRAIGLRDRLLMRCDPTVAFGLAILRTPVINLRWTIESNDPKIAAFCESQIRPLYRGLASAASLAIPMGWQVVEKVWENADVRTEVRAKDGTTDIVSFPNALTYHRFKGIHPSTLTLLVDSERDTFGGVRQRVSGRLNSTVRTGEEPTAGPERVILWSFRKADVWGALDGFPMLDQTYEPWWWKTAMNLFANRYFERRSEPPYKARAMASVRTSGGKEVDGFAFMRDMLAALRNGGAAILPSTRDDKGHPQFDVEFLQDDRRGDMFQGRLDYLDTQIMRSLLITDEAMTSQGSGGRTRSEVHFEALTFALETILNEWVGDVFQPQVIDPLVLYNFGERALRESRTRVKTTGLTEGQRTLLKEILLRVLDSDIVGEKGQRAIDRIELEKITEELGVPIRAEMDSAREAVRQAQEVPPEQTEPDINAIEQEMRDEGVTET